MGTLFQGNGGEDIVINLSCCFVCLFVFIRKKLTIISKYFEVTVPLYHYDVWGSEPFSHTKPTFDLLNTFGCPT